MITSTFTRNDITLSKALDHVIFGAWIVFEKHNKEHCNCSYCQRFKEDGKKRSLWLPKDRRRNSWRVWAVEKNDGYYYYRWTLPRLSAFLGFELTTWGGPKTPKGWRLRLGGFGMGKNSSRSLITITYPSVFVTKIPNIECLLWTSMIKRQQSNTGVNTVSTGASNGY